ncbi:lipid II:glycine glycyltransferase FemX [Candidatus Margulisiibacteriota bacterium]
MELKPVKDSKRFNDFVNASPLGHIHQTFEWGEIKSHFGWKPLRYIAEDNGKIVATISLLKTYRKGIPILYASRGPVLDYSDYNTINFLLPQLRELAKKEKGFFLRISPAVKRSNEGVIKLLEKNQFHPARNPQQHQTTMILKLEGKTSEQLLESFHHKHRYNIRLAFKKGMQLKKCSSEEELAAFYKLMQQMAKRQKYSLFPLEFYKTVFHILAPKQMAVLYLAYFEDKLVGGLFNLHFAGRSWYMWGAFDYEHRKLMANYGLHWTAIQDALQKGLKIYDLQGIPEDPDPKSPMWGFYNFKKGFNGDIVRWIGEFDSCTRFKSLYKLANKLKLV